MANGVSPTMRTRGSALWLRALCGGAVLLVLFLINVAHQRELRTQRRVEHHRRMAELAHAGSRFLELSRVARDPRTTSAVEGVAGNHGDVLRAFRVWAWAICDATVLAGALVDTAGNVTEIVPPDLVRPAALAEAVRRGTGSISLDPSPVSATLHLSESPGPYRVLLLSVPPQRNGQGIDGTTWSFALGTTAAAAGLFGLWHWTYRRTVTRPLAQIARALPTADLEQEGNLVERVAVGVAELRARCETTEARVRQLERTVDHRVSTQTRQIEGKLRRAEHQAWMDPLTRLGNRRMLKERLEEMLLAQRNAGEDLSVVAFDLDNFKQLNDSLGHAAGDEVLAFLGELLRGSLRSSDLGLRLGGDEFLVVLPGTNAEAAQEIATRLVRLFGQRASLYKLKPPVALSAGIASLWVHRPTDGAALVALADEALYRVKRSGKGNVLIHTAAPGSPVLTRK